MKTLLFLVLICLIIVISGPILVLGASPPYGQEIVVANSNSDEQIEAIAYNSLRSEMLVVWSVDAGQGNYDLWGRRASLCGAFHWLGQAFPIANTATSERVAAAAFNSSDNDYLIVYEYQFSEQDSDIWGQRVAGYAGGGDEGGELKGDAFMVGATVGNESSPDLIYLPSAQNFLVVYVLDDDVWGRRVARQHLGDGGGELIGSEFAIAYDFQHTEKEPHVQASTQQSYFLVTYTYAFTEDDWDVRGQRVRGFHKKDDELIDTSFDIAFTADSESQASIGYSQNAQAFIVAWEAAGAGNTDVRAAWFSEKIVSGNPLIDVPFAIAEDLVAQEQSPDVDVDPANGDVVVALSVIPDEFLQARIGTLWLNPDPHAQPHLLRPLSLFPERSFAMTSPHVELCPGQAGMILGFDALSSAGIPGDHDAYLLSGTRWATLLPLLLHN